MLAPAQVALRFQPKSIIPYFSAFDDLGKPIGKFGNDLMSRNALTPVAINLLHYGMAPTALPLRNPSVHHPLVTLPGRTYKGKQLQWRYIDILGTITSTTYMPEPSINGSKQKKVY